MSTSTISPGRRIRRYTVAERVVHWIAGLSFVYLLITGLAFYSPYFFWLSALVGGGPTARVWHPIMGVIFTVAVLWMYKLWSADMRMTEADRAWSREVEKYVRNEDETMPPAGRFNAGQKQLFWLMFLGGLLLFLSGLVLWFPESIPWSLRMVKSLAVLIHVAVALLTIGGFIIHVYMGTAAVPGSFTSITQGDVPESWARAHHRLWYDQVQRQAPAKK